MLRSRTIKTEMKNLPIDKLMNTYRYTNTHISSKNVTVTKDSESESESECFLDLYHSKVPVGFV